jgi:hypothetical protein
MNVREALASGSARHFEAGASDCERCRTVGVAGWCEGCGEQLCLRCWGDGDALFCGPCWHRRLPAIEDVVVTSGVL